MDKPLSGLVDWFDDHPRTREGIMALLFLSIIGASFYGGFHFRTIDNYVCYSYVKIDGLGRASAAPVDPSCSVANYSSSLNCTPGYDLLSYQHGVYIGPDPPLSPRNYSTNGYSYGEVSIQ